MHFQACLPVGFARSHESRMFEQLTKALGAGFRPRFRPEAFVRRASHRNRKQFTAQIKKPEREIDARVHRLHGLAPGGIKLVEEEAR